MSTVIATSWEPFARDLRHVDTPAETFIERVSADSTLSRNLDRYRTMSACGWDVVCVLAPDSKMIVALGCR